MDARRRGSIPTPSSSIPSPSPNGCARTSQHEGARKFIGDRGRLGAEREPGRNFRAALAWLIKACDGIDELFDDAQARPPDRRHADGRAQAWPSGSRTRSSSAQPVRSIEWNDKGAVVHSESISVAARHVIVAIPPNLAGAIEYEPSLPTNRVQVTQRWPQGLVIKVAMVYSAPFWRDDGLNGTSYDQFDDGRDGGLQQPGALFQGRHPHRLRLYRQRPQGRAAAGRRSARSCCSAKSPSASGRRHSSRRTITSPTGRPTSGRAAASPAS